MKIFKNLPKDQWGSLLARPELDNEKLSGEVNCALMMRVLFGPCVGSPTENIFSEKFRSPMSLSGFEPLMMVSTGFQPCAANAATTGTIMRHKESRESKMPRTFSLFK